jgi:predicted short-subunit dehydrogenase-like oxidoreductase (DUF2520 family)
MSGEVSGVLGFVGAGPVGRTLATAFGRSGRSVLIAHARPGTNDDDGAPFIWAESAAAVAARADITFLTVPDDHIAGVCRGISWRPGAAVVHCSGATELAALDTAAAAGAAVGGFHPLQMFANPAVALEGLAGCAVGIEAEPTLAGDLAALGRLIGLRPFTLPPGVRARYHASATYVGPFVIALLREATAIWRTFGADEADAVAALTPLLQGTMAAVGDRGLAGGMGGCVARGDLGTVLAHLAALDALGPETGALYRSLALRTVPLAVERGTLSEARAEQIAATLASPHGEADQ